MFQTDWFNPLVIISNKLIPRSTMESDENTKRVASHLQLMSKQKYPFSVFMNKAKKLDSGQQTLLLDMYAAMEVDELKKV